MNTYHRFFVAGLLTGLSLTASAEQLYQQPNQQYQQPQPRNYGNKVGNKALNGVTNLGTAWLEIPKGIINNTNAEDSNIIYGLVGGVIEGTLNTAGRATAGLADLVLAPLPTKPVVSPQYIWEDFYETDTAYSNIFRLDSTSNTQQPIFELPHQK